MLGTLHLYDLQIQCIVGIHPHERVNEQLLCLDVELDHDFAQAEATEHVNSTVDYTQVAACLTTFVQEQQFQLIETLAERGCALVFENWPEVSRCKLTVKKPAAVPAAGMIAVSVERRPAQS